MASKAILPVERSIYVNAVVTERPVVTNNINRTSLAIDPVEEVWNQYSLIPDRPPILSPNAGPGTGVVELITVFLKPVTGSTKLWEFDSYVGGPPPSGGSGIITRVIPSTIGITPGAYNPTLTGASVYDGQAWIINSITHRVEFATPPVLLSPILSFYRYTGLTGGLGTTTGGSNASGAISAVSLDASGTITAGSTGVGAGTIILNSNGGISAGSVTTNSGKIKLAADGAITATSVTTTDIITAGSTSTGKIVTIDGVSGGITSTGTITAAGSGGTTSIALDAATGMITTSGAGSGLKADAGTVSVKTVTATGNITAGSGGATSIALDGSTGMITAIGANGGLTATAGTVSVKTVTATGNISTTGTGVISSAGQITGGTVTSTGLLTAGGGQFGAATKIGTTTGAPNLALEIFHAAGSLTNGAGYLICRNSDGTDLGGFVQSAHGKIKMVADEISLQTGGLKTAGGPIETTGLGGFLKASALLTASGGISTTGIACTSLNANNGAIQTSGPLEAGAVTCTSLNANSGAIQTSGALGAGAVTCTRLTTSGGRQMRVTKYTGNTTLSVVDHYVSVANTSGSAITITLPPAPVDGQQYYIKATATSATNPIVVSSVGSGQILGTYGVPFNTLTMTTGETIFVVWSAAENQWLAINATAGNLGVLSLTTSGIVTATGGAIIGTTATSSPAKNPSLAILHASTDNQDCSYLICRNSAGTAIGGFDQTGQNTIKMSSDSANIGAGGLTSTGNLITLGGRTVQVKQYTRTSTISPDDHVIAVSNSTPQAIILTLPTPANPGQQYFIKVTKSDGPCTVNGTIIDIGGNTITSLDLTLGQAVILVWSTDENAWLMTSGVTPSSLNVSGNISAASLSTTGSIIAGSTGTGIGKIKLAADGAVSATSVTATDIITAGSTSTGKIVTIGGVSGGITSTGNITAGSGGATSIALDGATGMITTSGAGSGLKTDAGTVSVKTVTATGNITAGSGGATSIALDGATGMITTSGAGSGLTATAGTVSVKTVTATGNISTTGAGTITSAGLITATGGLTASSSIITTGLGGTITASGLITASTGLTVNGVVTFGFSTGVQNSTLAIKHPVSFSAPEYYLNCTNSNSTSIASITQVSQTVAALTVGRVATSGGRQLSVTKITVNNSELGIDHHVVAISNTGGGVFTTKLPLAPVGGQQYYIKVTANTSLGTCILDGNLNPISVDGTTAALTLPLMLGQAIIIVWSSTDSMWLVMSNTGGTLSQLTVTGGTQLNDNVTIGTGISTNPYLAIKHGITYSAPGVNYLNLTNSSGTSVASIAQVSQTMTALTVGRITTSSGRQLSVTKITVNNFELGIDHHVVAISNTGGGVFTTKLPLAPVGGQQYYIKVTAITSLGTCILDGNSNSISVDGTTAALTLPLVLGQAIIIVWNSTDSMWLVMSNTGATGATGGTGGGTLSQLTVSGVTQLNDNVTIGTAGVSKNPYLSITHGITYSAPGVDYLNLANSYGASIAKITQVSQELANLTVGGIMSQGGRQLRIIRVTESNFQLNNDHHVVDISNTTQSMLITRLPVTPMAGQQYYIKVTALTAPGTCNVYALGNSIMDANGISSTGFLPLMLGQAITLVWNMIAGVWMVMTNTAASGGLSVTSVTTSAAITASGLITASGGLKTTGRALGYLYIPPATYAGTMINITNSDNIIIINVSAGNILYVLPDNPIDGQEHMFRVIAATYTTSSASALVISGASITAGAKFLKPDGLFNIGSATSGGYLMPAGRGHVRIMWMAGAKLWVILESIARVISIPGSSYILSGSDYPVATVN